MEDKIVKILEEFEENAPDEIATGVIKKDGFNLADSSKKKIETKGYSAMSAGLYGLSMRVLNAIDGGNLIQTYVKGDRTELLIMTIPDTKLFVGVITRKDPNIGLIVYELEKTIEELKEVL